jgi:hypothetical protein
MAQNTPSNLIDATDLFAARRRDAEETQEARRALEIAARLRRIVEA